MRLALVHLAGRSRRGADDQLLECGVRKLLSPHTVVVRDIGQFPGDEPAPELLEQDGLVLFGETTWDPLSVKQFPWEKLHAAMKGKPVALWGATVPDAETTGLPNWCVDFLESIADRGHVSTAEPATRKFLENILGERFSHSGSAAIFAEFEPLVHRERRVVFCPPSPGDAGLGLQRLLGILDSDVPPLVIGNHPSDLDAFANPDLATFLSPHAPRFYGTALASASRVVSFRLVPALVAIAHGVPSILFARSEWQRKVADHYGIPCLSLTPGWQAAEVRDQIERTILDYPWETIESRLRNEKRQALSFLSTSKIAPARPPLKALHAQTERKATTAKLRLCTISDSNYLPYLMGFIENALEYGALSVHVLALDEGVRAEMEKRYPHEPVHVVSLDEVWEKHELTEILRRGIGNRAFSSKPGFIRKVLAESDGLPVVYCDSDVYFFESPQKLADAAQGASMLLFPHWNDDFSAARRDGLFNAGMLVANAGAEPFLDWWKRLCFEACRVDPSMGLVADQGYLDFAPVYSENVRIYREGDHDVARWNLGTLGVRWEEERPVLATGKRISTYHAAFVDELGVFEVKFAWDQLASYFSCYERAEKGSLASQVRKVQLRHWGSVARVLALKEALPAFLARRLSMEFLLRGSGKKWLERVFRLRQAWRRRTPETVTLTGGESARFWQPSLRGRFFELSTTPPKVRSAVPLSPSTSVALRRKKKPRAASR